jgi:hypothetical protein
MQVTSNKQQTMIDIETITLIIRNNTK